MRSQRRRPAISLLIWFVLFCSCVYAASSNEENESITYKIVDPKTTITENWIYIFGTFFLGICAIFAPYLSEEIKRRRFAPEIEIIFDLSPPFCYKTSRISGMHSVREFYYFRFGVLNKGRSKAKNCEVVLENVLAGDKTVKPGNYKDISFVNMNWSTTSSRREVSGDVFVDINPNRTRYCNLCFVNGHIKNDFNEDFRQELQRIKGVEDPIPFKLCANEILFTSNNSFPPGKYEIQLGLYSENAGHQKIIFEISWSGKLRENEVKMFNEMVIHSK